MMAQLPLVVLFSGFFVVAVHAQKACPLKPSMTAENCITPRDLETALQQQRKEDDVMKMDQEEGEEDDEFLSDDADPSYSHIQEDGGEEGEVIDEEGDSSQEWTPSERVKVNYENDDAFVDHGTTCLVEDRPTPEIMKCRHGAWVKFKPKGIQMEDTSSGPAQHLRSRRNVRVKRWGWSWGWSWHWGWRRRRCYRRCYGWWWRRCTWVCVPAPNRPPTVYCPPIPNYRADKHRTDAFVYWNPATAHDPEDGALGTFQTLGPRPYTRLREGYYTVSYRATDRRGSTRYCYKSFSVYVIHCSSDHLNRPSNGQVSCSHSNHYGSVCTYSCDTGYELIGASTSECLSPAYWNVNKPQCKAAPCTDPPSVSYGSWEGCESKLIGSKCTLACDSGYQVQGEATTTCQFRTSWTQPGSCIDVESPSFTCPSSISVYSAPKEKPTVVTWITPSVTDNSEETITVTSTHSSGDLYPIGDTQVTFEAKDSARNVKQCSMTITVIVKQCEILSPPDHGSAESCTHGRSVGSTCNITCHVGFDLIGVSQRECLDDQTWSHAQPQCQRVSCGTAPIVTDGSFSCPEDNVLYEAVCTLQCSKGYSINGPTTIACTSTATWTTPGTCIDTEKPTFRGCPQEDVVAAPLGDPTVVNYKLPQVQDNSHGLVTVVGVPARGSVFSLGPTNVLITATDEAGNINTCTMTINVEHGECQAPENTDLVAEENNRLEFDCSDLHVYGATCQLSCSDQNPVQGTTSIKCEKNASGYYWYYSNTKPFCEVKECSKIDAPNYGTTACSTVADRQICTLFCQKEYAYPKVSGQDSGIFYCDDVSGYWVPMIITTDVCKRGRPADSADLMSDMLYKYSGTCSGNHVEIKEMFINLINQTSVLKDKCGDKDVSCTLENVEITCGTLTKRDADRLRRSTSDLYLKAAFTISIIPEHPLTMTRQAIQDIADEINDAFYDKSISGDLDLPADTNTSTDHNSFGLGTVDYTCTGNTLPRPISEIYPVCLGCGPGRVFLSASEPCAKCPVGTYQPEEEASQCQPCPANTTTKYSGSSNSSDCLALCPSGSYSITGRRPNCDLCKVGSYQAGTGKAGCEKCAFGMSTHHKGSTSKDDCKFLDFVMTNETTVWPTFPNTTSFTSMGFICVPSDLDDTLTLVSLTRSDSTAASFGCGPLSIYITQTSSERRRNKRKCQHVAMTYSAGQRQLFVNGAHQETLTAAEYCSSFQLTFVPGDEGLTELLVNTLQMTTQVLEASEIQRHAESCDLQLTDNVLTSEEAFRSVTTFSSCDATDSCTDSPCGLHGTCIDQEDSFICECDSLWSGDICEIPPDFCQGHDCLNGATCVNQIEEGNYTCDCTSDFRGSLCGEEIVHGAWSPWDGWSQCSVSCNTGTRKRTRTCTNPHPDPDGRPCDGTDEEVDSACKTHLCPIDGGFNLWTQWTCSVTCDNGTAHRSRSCNNPAPKHGGRDCDGSREEHRGCVLDPCPVDGGYSNWADWSQCSKTCGTGVTQRDRNCTNPMAEHGGRTCIEQELGSDTETASCNTDECPVCSYLRRNEGQQINCETNTTTNMQECTLYCSKQGYVVGDTVYSCGILSNYTWSHVTEDNPSGKLPQCKKAETPAKRTFTVNAKIDDVSDSDSGAVASAIQYKAETNVNVSSNAKISTSVGTESSGSRKKRSSGTTFSVSVSVDSTSTGSDLSTASESELDAQMSVSNDFEDSAQALAENIAGVFDVTVNGQRYVAVEESISDTVAFDCNDGLEPLDGLCVECGPGTYWTNGLCEWCPRNQYQDGFRQMSCISCPDGYTTAGLGSQSIEDCEGSGGGGGSGSDDIIIIVVVVSVVTVVLIGVGCLVWYKCFRSPGKISDLFSSQRADERPLRRPSAWSASTNPSSRPSTAVTVLSIVVQDAPSGALIHPDKMVPPTYTENMALDNQPTAPPDQSGKPVTTFATSFA